MKLETYLIQNNISKANFAALVGVNRGAVYNWANGSKLPRRSQLAKIVELTNGQVQPQDFFTMPQLCAGHEANAITNNTGVL